MNKQKMNVAMFYKVGNIFIPLQVFRARHDMDFNEN